jgi:hypothetical protein
MLETSFILSIGLATVGVLLAPVIAFLEWRGRRGRP